MTDTDITFSTPKMREIRSALLAQIEMSWKLQDNFWKFVKSYGEEVRRMNKMFGKSVYPQIPELKFADSALWMFQKHRCAHDPMPHALIDCGNPWPGLHRLILKPKDPYFHVDPATDYNN